METLRAQDLKLGNIVLVDGTEREVGRLDMDGIYCIIPNCEKALSVHFVELNQVEGIPLTEEWLLKLGFTEGASGYYFKGDIVISVDRQVYFGETEAWIAEIATVHQLQNLVHALTGEELTIKGE